MATEALTLKGDKQGLKILINATFTEQEILDNLNKKLSEHSNFFKNSEVFIASNTIEKISYEFYKEIKDILESKLKLKVKSTYKTYLNESSTKELETLKTEFIIGSVRSGQFLEVSGHIVITGDINAGAQVHADGNIIVMGTIRGTVHAGYSGNRDSIIACKKFRAPQAQIRISNLIVFKSDEKSDIRKDLEIAHIKDNKIVLLGKDKKFK